jgi:hypothetical protein
MNRGQQYITCSKKYEKEAPYKEAKKVYIFCEGQRREVEYFRYFQGLDSRIDIIPIPNEKGQSDPEKLRDQSKKYFEEKELSSDYGDEVWFVIDTDEWNKGDKIRMLKDFVNKKKSVKNTWKVVQSNPCFEVWLYYHVYSDKPLQEKVGEHVTFKAFVNNIIQGGFDCRKHPKDLNNAIQNAEQNYQESNEQPELYSTQVFELGKSILPFVKSKLV